MKPSYVNVEFFEAGEWSDLPSEPNFLVEKGTVKAVTIDTAKFIEENKKGKILPTKSVESEPEFNKDGFNAEGFDKEGFNVDGFNVDGFNAEGFDKDGFNAEGFNAEGFDKDGFNTEGFDKDGNEKKTFLEKLTGKNKDKPKDTPPVKDKKKAESK